LALAGTKSLRSLAAAFGVSHETVRAALRLAETASAAEAEQPGREQAGPARAVG